MVEAAKKRKKPAHKKALGLINKPEKATKQKQRYERIACVFQGGGALGAYQVGAFQAIHERGYHPNFLAGVSIGAINSSIIAGNPREKQIDKLMEFWDTISPNLWLDLMINFETWDFTHHLHNRLGALHSLFFGLEGFFKPRSLPPTLLSNETPDRLSYYDTTELRRTLERVIDFDRINDNKDVTLCLGAVNVTSGEMIFFNNQMITITPEHVMASGALPPGFPAIKIGDDYFWDGGIYANTPLVTVLDALPEKDTLCFVVDCFSLQGPLPRNMDQLEERQKDIRYASHSRRLTNVYTSRQNLQAAIHYLSGKLSPEAKKDPEVQRILELGHEKRFSVVHIIYNGTPYSHSFKDYNFIRSAINLRIKTGYQNAIDVLNKPEWEQKSNKKLACSIYGVSSDYFNQH
ncbi:patatin-like phospholipase family protein [Legionella jordanis]|uniref:Patatin-like phospholipase n=1 Tax=Legionella jordanis TaxID=456 RepID=A0A0W0V9L5_9GAMM|nr:patatin-like phospholipase family protein [Legionella jordanis]KTD16786.1 patatin-like phospholipase [Legionella jordanis]RMX03686.1 patatin-like phospholipase family protein [Legionella jordanis]RMX22252.1 patatin-like phospholipase family protein [Legionella jordanis]VEH11746.1 patatin-like phospholipase [Legionella jordanis]HAT8712944.1 patatin-like phospholipase family protein [Legionella jordanis]